MANLDDLPTELVQRVAGYLSLPDKASLTFVNHRLHKAIGSEPWRAIRSVTVRPPVPLITFLRSLSRDLNGWVYYQTCYRLHPSTLKQSLIKAINKDGYDILQTPLILNRLRTFDMHMKAIFKNKPKNTGCFLELLWKTFESSLPLKSTKATDVAIVYGIKFSVVIVRWPSDELTGHLRC